MYSNIKARVPGIALAILALGATETVLAHCPLCTAGAGAAAVTAKWLGIGTAPIGIFIGAFGVAMGIWISNLLKKRYIPYQAAIFAIVSLVLTVVPLMPLMPGLLPFYVSLSGEYGSVLNRTYVVNQFLLGAVLGAILLGVAPYLSQKITSARHGKNIPFQGLVLTFTLLVLVALILELWIS